MLRMYRCLLILVLSVALPSACADHAEQGERFVTHFVGKELLALDDAYYIAAQALAQKGDPQEMGSLLMFQHIFQQLCREGLRHSVAEGAEDYRREFERRLSSRTGADINYELQSSNDFAGAEYLALDTLLIGGCMEAEEARNIEALMMLLFTRWLILKEGAQLLLVSQHVDAPANREECLQRLSQCTAMRRVLAAMNSQRTGGDQVQADEDAAQDAQDMQEGDVASNA